MRHLSFDEVAASLITRFVKDDEIPEMDLRDIIMRSFEAFRAPGTSTLYSLFLIILLLKCFLFLHIRDRCRSLSKIERILGVRALPRTNIRIQRRSFAITRQFIRIFLKTWP
jgi:hypothetical protein